MRMKRMVAALAGAAAIAAPAASFAQAASKPESDGGARQSLTAAERKAMLESMKQLLRDDDAGLKAVTRSDGTEILDLQGRYQSVAVARMDGGKTVVGCVTNAAEANAFANGATPNADSHAEGK